MFLAYLLAPPVHHLQRWLTRTQSVCVVFGAVTLGSITTFWVIMPRLGAQLRHLASEAPAYTATLVQTLSLGSFVERHFPGPLREPANQALERFQTESQHFVLDAIAGLRFVPLLVVVPAIAFFLLKDALAFQRSALHLLPLGRTRWRGQDFLEEVNTVLANYVRAQLVACAWVAFVSSIAFAIMGLPSALVLGLFAGVIEFIPMIGPLTAAGLACIAATFAPEGAVIQVVVFSIVLRLFQDYVVFPRLVGGGVKLHPLIIILVILSGAHLFGMAGLFFAIPLTAILTVAYRHFSPDNERPTAEALSHTSFATEIGALSGLRVVLVDNEADALALLKGLLERAGARVTAAESAAEARRLIVATKPHVLVSDLEMPNEDGLDLIRQVRGLKDAEVSSVPAIALTGYAMPEDRRRSLLAGFQAHVSKPVDPHTLIALVARLGFTRHELQRAMLTGPADNPA